MGTAVVAVWVYLANRDRATNERVASLAREMNGLIDGHQNRLTRLETLIEHLPTHRDVADLRADIAELGRVVERLSAESNGLHESSRALWSAVEVVRGYLQEHRL